MTHLLIAENLLSKLPIKSPEDFVLGSIAPDSVHHQENFSKEAKKPAHFVRPEERWGYIKNVDFSIADVVSFLNTHTDKDSRSFVLGYGAHILADIQNFIHIWHPFVTTNPDHENSGIGKVYANESFAIDNEFHSRIENTTWKLLSDSKPHGIQDRIELASVGRMRTHILTVQYKDKKNGDPRNNRIVRIEEIERFIDHTSEYILDKYSKLM